MGPKAGPFRKGKWVWRRRGARKPVTLFVYTAVTAFPSPSGGKPLPEGSTQPHVPELAASGPAREALRRLSFAPVEPSVSLS